MTFTNAEKFFELCKLEAELENLYNTIEAELIYIQDKKSATYANQVGRLLGVRAGIYLVAEKIEQNDRRLGVKDEKVGVNSDNRKPKGDRGKR